MPLICASRRFGNEAGRSFVAVVRVAATMTIEHSGSPGTSRSPAAVCRLLALVLVWTGNTSAAVGAAESDLGTANPLAYCARVRTLDLPPGGGSPAPRALESYVRTALGLSVDAAFVPENYYWRCMDRAVYVCAIGANLPCAAKADRSKRNTGAEQYCRDNPGASAVPASATGPETIYEWRCVGASAMRGRPTATLDRRGYRTDIWHRISPP
jgi:hypothetical protein